MKFNPDLKKQIEKYQDYVVLVEGKKDVASLHALGFKHVYAIHKTGAPLREHIESICKLVEKKQKVCILTDLDKQGKKLYFYIKPILQENGIRVDSTLRGILIKAKVSHIESLDKFMKKIDGIY
jgi:5S rRNA maturation endonuclease (ribonuclease M5)